MKKLMLLLTIIILCGTSCNNKTDISGKWKSEKVEGLGNGSFGKRVFKMVDSSWEVNFTLYLDSAASSPVFTFHATGTYTLGNPSATVKGATEAVFRFDHKFITLHSSDTSIIKNFGFSSCNLTPGKEKEITATGCSFLENNATCAQEYDLIKLVDKKLYLGARPEAGKSICIEANRPEALGLPLVSYE